MPAFRALISILIFLSGGCASTLQTVSPEPETVVREPADPRAVEFLIAAKVYEFQGKHAKAAAELEKAVAIDSSSVTLSRALVENYLRANNPGASLSVARRAVSLDSSSVELRWLFVTALRKTGDDSTAAEEMESILALDPQQLEAYTHLADFYRRTAQPNRLIAVLDRLRQLPNLTINTRLQITRQYVEVDLLDKAEAECRAILEEHPETERAWQALGLIQIAMKDSLAAAKTCRRALSATQLKMDSPVRQFLVSLYRTKNLLDSTLEEVPPDTTFLSDLGRSFLASRLFPEATRTFERIISAPHPSVHQWIDAAFVYGAQGNIGRSAEILRKALAMFPDNDGLLYHFGRTLMGMGELEEAEEAFRKAYALNPDHHDYQYGIGLVYQRQKRWSNAVQTFTDLSRKVPERSIRYIDVLFGLGSSLERSGRFEDSVEAFQKLINLSPRHAEALNYLGYMFAEKGIRLDEAETLVKRALAEDPDNGAFLDSLGWTHYQRGQYNEAEKLLDKAIHAEIKRNGDEDSISIIWEHIGDNAMTLGKQQKALESWQKAIQANPSNKKIGEKLQALKREMQNGK